MLLLLILFPFSIQICAQASNKKPVLWGNLSPGSHGVGFTVKTFSDESRKNIDQSRTGRLIELMIWYPVGRTSVEQKLTFRDYVSLLAVFRNGFTKSEIHNWLATSITGKSTGIGTDKLAEILRSEMHAVEDAKMIGGQFPLVLWTMRHETTAAQSVLCEYLASHGYVIAVARNAGDPLPYPWAIKTPEKKIEVFKTHFEDLNFALKTLSTEKNVDSSKVTIINWSYAAELSPLMQIQNSNVGLVIGLSSNPLSSFGLYQGASAAANLKTDKLNVPYVIMTEHIGPNGKVRTLPPILKKLSKESYFVSFPKLAHGNFNTLEGMIPGVFEIENVQPWSKGGKTAKMGYEVISRQTLIFLNKYMKIGAKSNKKKLLRKMPKGFVNVTRISRK